MLAVIRNPIYKGTLIQNRYETVRFGDNKKIAKRDKSEWSIVENQVPAIVSRELFDKVNSLFNGYRGNRQKELRYEKEMVERMRGIPDLSEKFLRQQRGRYR